MTNIIWLTVLGSCCAWSGLIHEYVAESAFKKLSKPAKRYIREHLGDDSSSLRAASRWADSDAALEKYPDSDDLHYSHTPRRACDDFQFERDCGVDGAGRCIVSGLVDSVLAAIDTARSPSDRTDALRFILHLIADIHQPLHTGFSQDSGGVNIRIWFDDKRMSLHQLWDHSIVISSLRSMTAAPNTGPSPLTDISDRTALLEFFGALASESSTEYTCRHAYLNEDSQYISSGDVMSREYLESRKAVAMSRIGSAITRLIIVLDRVGDEYYSKKTPSPASMVSEKNPSIFDSRNTNRYSILEIDFDPEEYIDDTTTTTEVVTSGGRHYEKPKTQFGESEESYLYPQPTLVIGRTRIDEARMIKREDMYMITCKSLLESNPQYTVFSGKAYVVKFKRSSSASSRRAEPVLFVIDIECFEITGSSYLTTESAMQIILEIRGEDPRNLEKYFRRGAQVTSIRPVGGFGFHPIRDNIGLGFSPQRKAVLIISNNRPEVPPPNEVLLGSLEALVDADRAQHEAQVVSVSSISGGGGHFKSLSDKWDYEFYTKMRDLVTIGDGGNIRLVLHKESLLKKRMTCFMHSIMMPDGERFTAIFDRDIFDGTPTVRIGHGFITLFAKNQIKGQSSLMERRPSLPEELRELSSIFNGVDETRADRLETIKEICVYPGVAGLGRLNIEWSID